jgi:hypothetical protein
MPTPTGFDASWECPAHGKAGAWIRIEKHD